MNRPIIMIDVMASDNDFLMHAESMLYRGVKSDLVTAEFQAICNHMKTPVNDFLEEHDTVIHVKSYDIETGELLSHKEVRIEEQVHDGFATMVLFHHNGKAPEHSKINTTDLSVLWLYSLIDNMY